MHQLPFEVSGLDKKEFATFDIDTDVEISFSLHISGIFYCSILPVMIPTNYNELQSSMYILVTYFDYFWKMSPLIPYHIYVFFLNFILFEIKKD